MKTLAAILVSTLLSVIAFPVIPTERTKIPNVYVPRNKKDLKRRF